MVSAQRLPLGIWDTDIFARERLQEITSNHQQRDDEDKESYRWLQGYVQACALAAAAPVCALFYFLAVRRTPAWRAAVYAFAVALLVALAVFRMPAVMVAGAVADGMVFGWFRIAWIVVAAVFVYDISVESGQFEIIKRSVGEISSDRRLQVLFAASRAFQQRSESEGD